jgi:DNA-binding NarL/FixJ family response regulator
VFIVDDHTMFREGLKQLIERERDLVVCGEASDMAGGLAGIGETQPDVVLVDISLAGASGIDLIKAIKSEHEDMPILVVSMHDEALYAERALRAGAMGYVMKNEPARTMKAAIKKVMAGDMALSEKMASRVISRLMHRHPEEVPASPVQQLSDRELEVFKMLGEAKGVREIAERLNITIATVNSFRNRIKEKLGLKSSTEVMLHAIQWSRDSTPV